MCRLCFRRDGGLGYTKTKKLKNPLCLCWCLKVSPVWGFTFRPLVYFQLIFVWEENQPSFILPVGFQFPQHCLLEFFSPFGKMCLSYFISVCLYRLFIFCLLVGWFILLYIVTLTLTRLILGRGNFNWETIPIELSRKYACGTFSWLMIDMGEAVLLWMVSSLGRWLWLGSKPRLTKPSGTSHWTSLVHSFSFTPCSDMPLLSLLDSFTPLVAFSHGVCHCNRKKNSAKLKHVSIQLRISFE